jgi:hypothetical protein
MASHPLPHFNNVDFVPNIKPEWETMKIKGKYSLAVFKISVDLQIYW